MVNARAESVHTKISVWICMDKVCNPNHDLRKNPETFVVNARAESVHTKISVWICMDEVCNPNHDLRKNPETIVEYGASKDQCMDVYGNVCMYMVKCATRRGIQRSMHGCV